MRHRTLLAILLMAICFFVKAADGTTTYVTSSMLGITMADATLTFDGDLK
jgi:hypothetical protein